ncbi:MAG: hypothetical protein IJE62_02805 [Clostridia bacterium]|nr:hypothetical protein [Clostridia bacterium]MBR1970056.1 hypothetical protein [Clostridia bacterium]MBR2884618.1 hypothetical protein [Clostridia bacterium]
MNDFPYEDIINLPHQKSKTRKPMPILNRAAQFAPFAALTGYDEAVKETARLTDERMELDEYTKDELNRKLLFLQEHTDDEITATITYFVPDERKSGGEYVSLTGTVKKIKEYENVVVLNDDTEIPIQEILLIESEAFNQIEE